MNCEEVRRQWWESDGKPGPEVAEHLARCPVCADLVRRQEALAGLIRLKRFERPDEAAVDRVARRVELAIRGTRPRPVWWPEPETVVRWAAMAAAAVLVGWAGWGILVRLERAAREEPVVGSIRAEPVRPSEGLQLVGDASTNPAQLRLRLAPGEVMEYGTGGTRPVRWTVEVEP